MLPIQESEAEPRCYCTCDVYTSLIVQVFNVKGTFCLRVVALNTESYKSTLCVFIIFS